MHRVANFGSLFQAMSLARLIGEIRPEARVEFIDYRPGAIVGGEPKHGSPKWRHIGELARDPVDYFRYLSHKALFSRRYHSLLRLPAKANHQTSVDLQIIGSDEVFNCLQDNVRVGYSRDLFGFDSRARRLATYAASFGNTTLRRLRDAGIAGQVGDDLREIEYLSVRDANSAEIVEELIGYRPLIHVDPVLAYGISGYEREIAALESPRSPYLLIYGYPHRLSAAEILEIRDYAAKRKLRVLSIGGVQVDQDRYIDASPFEALALIRNAAAVVTDTFHGTIFAALQHQRVAVIARGSEGGAYGNAEKLGYLMEMLGLGHSMAIPSITGQLESQTMDYAAMDRKLEVARAESRDYLTRILA